MWLQQAIPLRGWLFYFFDDIKVGCLTNFDIYQDVGLLLLLIIKGGIYDKN